MLHGKKGFERVVWACKNILGKSLSWLFYDFGKTPIAEDHPNPLAQHHPIHQTIAPEITQVPLAKVPSFATSNARQDDQDWTAEIHEWLNLVALQSPRVETKDDTDPYLCCYHIPCSGVPRNYDLVSLKWNGFLPASWIRSLFVELWYAKQSRGTPVLMISTALHKSQSNVPRTGSVYLLTLFQQTYSTIKTDILCYDSPVKMITMGARLIHWALICCGK